MTFEIVLDQPVLESASSGSVFDRVNDLVQRIIAKATELLKDNLPPWAVVETAVRSAYDLYVRPLSLPNFLDNIVCNAVVREVKKIYSGNCFYATLSRD